ncbi:hypothetical protein IJG76_01110 [Candidatus Saccharibacteria bacterium]|nr:hypothetical protein [Candidatus Saccharibacteria bacterium]
MSGVYYYKTKYLIDETPAASLKNEWMRTDFFKENCFVPEEIMYELRDNYELDLNELKKSQIPVSYDILNALQIVMAQAKIVKLYQNEGNGDALIVATAMAMRNLENTKLIKDEWAIVTSDKGVVTLAKNLAIKCIDKNSFYGVLKQKFKNEQEKNSGSL